MKLFDANKLLDKVKTENMLLLDKVKNLELELSVTREQTNRFANSKLEPHVEYSEVFLRQNWSRFWR